MRRKLNFWSEKGVHSPQKRRKVYRKIVSFGFDLITPPHQTRPGPTTTAKEEAS